MAVDSDITQCLFLLNMYVFLSEYLLFIIIYLFLCLFSIT